MRTGRASLSMLDGIRVDYYGHRRPSIKSAVGRPDPTLVTIQPWDPTILHAIEKALRQSDLDLNPRTTARSSVSRSHAHRGTAQALVKHAHKAPEDGAGGDPQRPS